MPTCKECGFTAPILQWTHFKYKCTGKFRHSREYKEAYPNEPLIDPELAKNNAITLNNMILRHGEIEGKKKWEQYRQKQAYSNSLEAKIKKHGWTEKEFEDFNKSRAVTLHNLIKKYGETEGIQRWESYLEKQKYTNTLEYFIEKYGNIGEEKWNEYNISKGNSSNLYFIMQKYNVGFTEAEIILRDRNKTPQFTSKSEKKFVDNLIEILGEIKYTYKTKQFCIWSDTLNTPLFYDVTCSTKKKIIEYNGDYWHCNPKKYSKDFILPHNNRKAEEIWNRDKEKHNAAKNRGFDLLVVWESDVDSDPLKIYNQIKDWWNK